MKTCVSLVSVFLFILLFNGIECKAQIAFEPIEIGKKGLFGKKYYERCDVEMDGLQLSLLFAKDPQMKKYSKKLSVNYLASTLLSSTGSVLFFWPIVQELGNNDDPDWVLLAVGAGLVVASIPFTKWFDKRAAEAVEYYNNGYQTGFKPSFNLDLKGNGIGLSMQF